MEENALKRTLAHAYVLIDQKVEDKSVICMGNGSIFSKEGILDDIARQIGIIKPKPEHENLIKKVIDKNMPADGTEATEKMRTLCFELGRIITNNADAFFVKT